MQVSKDFVFHFEGVNALFSKLRRAVEMISSLNSADLEPGGAAGGVVPLVTLDKAKDGKQKQVRKGLQPTPRHGWSYANSNNLPYLPGEISGETAAQEEEEKVWTFFVEISHLHNFCPSFQKGTPRGS